MIGTPTFEATRGEQYHARHVTRVLEATALAALDNKSVDAGRDRLQRSSQSRHDVEDREPGGLQRGGVLRRVTRRGGDEPNSLIDDELHDAGVSDESLRDVHAERLVGEVAHLGDLGLHRVELA